MAETQAGGRGGTQDQGARGGWPASIAAACAYLLRTQNPAGSWTDFWLPVGTSDAWVTAFVGLAMHAVSVCPALGREVREASGSAAQRAADWLLAQPRPRGGWGYNASAPPDADSTAHALSLLARLGRPVPREALAFLRAHEVPGVGFRTYAWPNPDHAWTRPCPDVTAAALRALWDLGELDQEALWRTWQETVEPWQRPGGEWSAFWWGTPSYPTGLALEVWTLAGRPPLPQRPGTERPVQGTFDLAWNLHTRAWLEDTRGAAQLAEALRHAQQADGGWPSAPILRVPPAHPGGGGVTLLGQDARRVFTTASAVRALALAVGMLPEVRLPRRPCRSTTGAETSTARLIHRAARAAGFGLAAARAARTLFGDLTHECLTDPSPWPSRQLSALSGGMPLEFSVVAGLGAGRALRYAAEVGNPFLPPPARARNGLMALERAARTLGYGEAWARVQPAAEALTSPALPVPDGLRFLVWGGVDQAAPSPKCPAPCPILKLYFNLLHRELGGGRERLDAALGAAGIPLPPELSKALYLLDAAGFVHELGFGLGPGGKVACKVYYELPGWRRPLAQTLLHLARLPSSPDDLCPEIPGLLRESLAAHSRAGLGLRLDAESGEVRELMAASAFPTPLLPLPETIRRVEAWLTGQGWDAEPYRALCATLAPGWPDRDTATRSLHSLLTRTVSREGARAAIYLRPWLFPEGSGKSRGAGW